MVAEAEDVPAGTRRRVTVDGRGIVILNVDGLYYALRDTCPHRGARLSDGVVVCGALSSAGPGDYTYTPERKVLKCPWHGWEFDLATGQSWVDPARTKVRSYPVDVESGGQLRSRATQGPYVAETIPVTVEGDYLVLTLELAPAAAE